ncbi:alpha/beta fold hydrolase [Streptomyces sp. NPDC055254]
MRAPRGRDSSHLGHPPIAAAENNRWACRFRSGVERGPKLSGLPASRGDVAAFLDHLGPAEVALLGHSLGGVNAYQFAARHPERVTALIVEDIGAVCDIDLAFARNLPDRVPTRGGLVGALGAAAPYLEATCRERAEGWGFAQRRRRQAPARVAHFTGCSPPWCRQGAGR